MFICEECGKKEGIDSFWFTVGPLSRGKCELCDKTATCYDWQGYKKEPAKEKSELQKAVEVLIAELSKDKSEGSYYYSWQANIAMAFKDEYDRQWHQNYIMNKSEFEPNIHAIANQAAKDFLDSLCGATEYSPTIKD